MNEIYAKRILRVDIADSTNETAKRLGIGGAPDGYVVVAAEQTAGRGRMGREWQSPRGGLWMSMIIRPPESRPEIISRLSIAAGIAAASAIDEILSELGARLPPAGLGWPNDVLFAEKKIAGILCEAHSAGAGNIFAVAGIGININNTASSLLEEISGYSTSILDLTGKEFSLDTALEKVIRYLDNSITVASSDDPGGFEHILDEWRKRSALFGRKVEIRPVGGATYSATPFGLDGEGRLLVRDKKGKEIAVQFDEAALKRNLT